MRWPELVETFPEPLNEVFKGSYARMALGTLPEDSTCQRIWLEITVPDLDNVFNDKMARTISSLVIPWFVSKLKPGQRMVGFYFETERNQGLEDLQAQGATIKKLHIRRRKRVKPSSTVSK